MELTDSFTVRAPAERLWEVLTDVTLIAPCVPGFELKEAADPEYRGTMKIKVGAITVAYDATIAFAERDDAAKRAVLTVQGREQRAAGTVHAKVTATLSEDGGQTTVDMVTDVQLTGRVAQFGRGIIGDVASRLTGQFVDNLEERVLREPAGAAAAPAAGPPARETPAGAPSGDALDLAATAFGPVMKRAAPIAAGLLLLFLVLRRAGRSG